MFYKQFLNIANELNPEFVEKFDYWIATLPVHNQQNIMASVVSGRLEVTYSQAETILDFAEKQDILEKYYLVKCPDCNCNLATISKDDFADVLLNPQYCDDCEEDKKIGIDDIYTAYRVIKKPDVTESDIAKEIKKRLGHKYTSVNFNQADSLADKMEVLYEAFYNPDESAYQKLLKTRENFAKY